jgi:hypothetical protein
MATQGEIASAFLRELRAPDTPLMRKAVIAWMRKESGSTIRANNPWNMTLRAASETGVKTCGSWKSQSSGLVFAVFCTPQDGARASARLLLAGGDDWRGYGRVVRAARKGDPIAFLDALARSAWSADRYGGPNNNSLLRIYKSLGGDVSNAPAYIASTTIVTGGQIGASAVSTTSPLAKLAKAKITGTESGGMLGAWGDIVSFPVGHIVTAADVDYMMAQLASHGYFKDDPAGVAQSITRAILNTTIGKPWNKSLQISLQKAFFSAASEAIPKTPLTNIGGAFIQILAALFDPRKWLLVLALIAGAMLTAYGGTSILAAAR